MTKERMSQPKPFTYVWQQEELTIHLAKLRENRDGDLKAEMEITTTRRHDQAGNQYQPIIYDAKFNLSSNRARLQFAKEMLPIYEADWEQIISEVCQRAKREFREGEPVVEISISEGVNPPKYLLKPLLLENRPMVLYGDSGIGKSNFALLLSLCVSLPWHDNYLGFEVNEHRIAVLYLDYETETDDIQWNVDRLIRGLDIIEAPILYRRCVFPLCDEIDEIKDIITENNIGLVIIDSLLMACSADLNTSEAARQFNKALRQLRAATLIIAHTSKQDEKAKTIYGSAFFKAIARSVWEMRQTQEVGEDTLDLALFNRKANLSRLHKPLGFHLTFTDNAISVRTTDIRAVEGLRQGLTTQAQILAILREGRMSTAQLAEEMGITPNAINVAASRLRKGGKVQKRGDDWELPSDKGEGG